MTATQGIIHPAMAYRWRFVVKKPQPQDKFDPLTTNTLRCEVDYKNSELQLTVEENILGDVSDVVYDLVKRPSFTCYVHTTDGNDRVPFSQEFLQSKVIKHSLLYDYAESGVLTHHLTIKFSDIRLLVQTPEKAP